MADKAWLLNPTAIRVAKKCILCVQDELGVKLKLSHPDFMQMLHEYVELTDSDALSMAYAELLSFVGVGETVKNLRAKDKNVVSIKKTVNGETFVSDVEDHIEVIHATKNTESIVVETMEQSEDTPKNIEYRGKSFPAVKDGKRFKGFYRGQPCYR